MLRELDLVLSHRISGSVEYQESGACCSIVDGTDEALSTCLERCQHLQTSNGGTRLYHVAVGCLVLLFCLKYKPVV
jgi:hypothetical protein